MERFSASARVRDRACKSTDVHSLHAQGGKSRYTYIPMYTTVYAHVLLFALLPASSCASTASAADAVSLQKGVLHLSSDAAFDTARAKHLRVMIMVGSKYDPSCSLAADLFKRAAALWSANVTFARMDVDEAPRAAAAVGNEISSSCS